MAFKIDTFDEERRRPFSFGQLAKMTAPEQTYTVSEVLKARGYDPVTRTYAETS